jgi:hypothetical protein
MIKAGNWVIWYDRTNDGQSVSRVGQVLALVQPGTVVNRALLDALHINSDKFLHDLRGPGQDATSDTDSLMIVSMPNPLAGKPYLIIPNPRKLMILSSAHAMPG